MCLTFWAKNKIISLDLAQKMKMLVGLRNLLAHEYGELNFELLYEQAHELNYLEEFASKVAKLL